jgi:hypothetical protein
MTTVKQPVNKYSNSKHTSCINLAFDTTSIAAHLAKVKLCLCLSTSIWRHVWERRYSSMLFETSSPDRIEVSLMLRPYWILRWVSPRACLRNLHKGKKNLFPRPEIEPRSLGCQVPSLLTMPTEPSRPQHCCIGLFLILGPKIHGKSNLRKIITALFDIYVGCLKTGDNGILMWRSSNRWAQQQHAVMGYDASSSWRWDAIL